MQEETEQVSEAGRVISRANGNVLRAAYDALKSLLSFVEQDEDAGDEAEAVAEVTEAALEIAYVPLLEQSVRGDGTMEIRVISDGWGSSGYYPAEVLERDGPNVFTRGTKMYVDHPTRSEEIERPERSVRDLAAELVSDARWVPYHPKGPGLYADAKVFEAFQPMINELAPHIGVSIRASGKASQGEAQGRKGPIITQITSAQSVDLVTEPGANGRIVQMFESARGRVARSTESIIEKQEESSMSENEVKEMKEAIAKMEEQNRELAESNARLRETQIATAAKELVREALAKTSLPQVTQTRLLVRLAANPPVSEGTLNSAALLERVKAEVTEETQYLNSVRDFGTGRVEGMGLSEATQPQTQEATTKRLTESFMALGLSEASAAQAASSGW